MGRIRVVVGKDKEEPHGQKVHEAIITYERLLSSNKPCGSCCPLRLHAKRTVTIVIVTAWSFWCVVSPLLGSGGPTEVDGRLKF